MSQLICGNALDVLPTLDKKVHAVITSPPYWGLRDYGCPEVVFGGDKECDHRWSSLTGCCHYGGAWRGQFGLEPTPEMYVEHTLEFLRAIRKVLRDDGVVWWNIGDSYASTAPGTRNAPMPKGSTSRPEVWANWRPETPDGLKPKDLVMIPFRVALAAQADGWWVRSVVIWSKPNPMPESVRDRPTTAHEYVLLLTKSGDKQYWTHPTKIGMRTQPEPDYRWRHKETGEEVAEEPPGDWRKEWNRRNLWEGHDYFYDADAIREPSQDLTGRGRYGEGGNTGGYKSDKDETGLARSQVHHEYRISAGGRNKRTVWTIPTQPYKGPHYATFPPKLVEPMVLTTPTKVCAECGAGWERVTERIPRNSKPCPKTQSAHEARGGIGIPIGTVGKSGSGRTDGFVTTLGFRPTCSCDAGEARAVILDPFGGTGTVAQEAERNGRDWIVIDIDPKSIEMTEERLKLGPVEYETAEGLEWVQPKMFSRCEEER